jgi:hypothetical protein
MRERGKFRLLMASALCAWIVLDALLAWRGSAALSEMVTLPFATTAALVFWRRSGQKLKPDTNEPSNGVADLPPEGPVGNDSMVEGSVLREVSLAIEHIQSIRVLLDISRAHRQPIPSAVFGNLDLVCRRLRQVQNRVES